MIFPQGELYSSHISMINFEKGLSKIIASSKKQFQYLFAAVLIDYFDQRKPSVNVFLERWEAQEYTRLQLIKSAFNRNYEDSVREQSSTKV